MPTLTSFLSAFLLAGQLAAQQARPPLPGLGGPGDVVEYVRSSGAIGSIVRDSIAESSETRRRVLRRVGSGAAEEIVFTRTPDGIIVSGGSAAPVLVLPATSLRASLTWSWSNEGTRYSFRISDAPPVDSVISGRRTRVFRATRAEERRIGGGAQPIVQVTELLLSEDFGVLFSRTRPDPRRDDLQFLGVRRRTSQVTAREYPSFCKRHRCSASPSIGFSAGYAEVSGRSGNTSGLSDDAIVAPSLGVDVGLRWFFLGLRGVASAWPATSTDADAEDSTV